MSQELLPLFQWVGIVIAAGLLYNPLSPIVKQYTQFNLLWSNITAYLLVALCVHMVYRFLKRLLEESLMEKDVFGGGEFYFGMAAGVMRFACMLVVGIALMNSRIITAGELAANEKFQKENFEAIRFPTYGQVQQEILFRCLTGKLIEDHLHPVLIASLHGPGAKASETIAQKNNKMLDDIIGGEHKR